MALYAVGATGLNAIIKLTAADVVRIVQYAFVELSVATTPTEIVTIKRRRLGYIRRDDKPKHQNQDK